MVGARSGASRRRAAGRRCRAVARGGRRRARAGAGVDVAHRLATRRNPRPRRDRRSARCSGVNLSRTGRATSRRRCPTARRSWLPRARRCARRGSWRRAGVLHPGQPGRQRHRWFRVDGGRCRPSQRAGHHRRALRAICASCTTRTGCSARPVRDTGRASTTTAAASSRSCRRRSSPESDCLFATPHGLDLVDVARAHGVAKPSGWKTRASSGDATPGRPARSSFPSTDRVAWSVTASSGMQWRAASPGGARSDWCG